MRMREVRALDAYQIVFNLFAALVLLHKAPALALVNLGLMAFIGFVVPRLAAVPFTWARALRHLYFLPAIVFYYEETYALHTALYGSFVLDRWLLRADSVLFGGQIYLLLADLSPSRVFGELMSLAYLAFYPLVIWVGLWSWRAAARGRDDPRLVHTMVILFMSCYVLSSLLPSAGPRYYMQSEEPITGFLGAAVLRVLLAVAERPTAAFPSSHVAFAVVLTCWTWNVSRRAFVVMLPLTLALSLATIYTQEHYAIDAVTGALYGLVVWRVGEPARLFVERALRTKLQFAHS